MNNIPKHWQVKKLGEVCKFYQGYGFPKDLQGSRSGEYPFYKVGDISKNVKAGNRYLNLCDNFIDEKTLIKLKAKPYPKHTIVFAKIGEGLKLNRRAIINKSGIVDNNAIGLKAIESICNDLFLFHFLTTVKLEDYSKATTVPSVRKSEIEDIHFVLPPLPEQLAIVSKIEELLSDLENGKQQLLTAKQQLKVYRQSLLKAAFEGRLTNKEVKDGKLPKGWKVVELKNLVEKISDGPFGSNLKSIDYVDKGVRVIRLENIGEMEFRDEYKTFVTPEKYETIKNHTVGKGDIIFSSFIIVSIRSVILPDYIERAINKADCFLVRVSETKINKKYLAYYFSTKAMRNQLVSQIHGATRPRINTTQLKLALIPVPTLLEQHQIVEILESKLIVCDKIEETIAQSLLKAETLKQCILKKAFEGKLV